MPSKINNIIQPITISTDILKEKVKNLINSDKVLNINYNSLNSQLINNKIIANKALSIAKSHKPNKQEATFIIAAYNSLHPEQADYVCDGIDDQIQIQAAIDDMVNGGRVLLKEGRFNISNPILIDKSMMLEGSTISTITHPGTAIVLQDNSNCDMIQVDGNGTHLYFPQLQNFYLDGKSSTQSSGNGINYIADLSDGIAQNIFVHNCKETGILGNAGWYMKYINVWSEYNRKSGFDINNGYLVSCVSQGNYEYGILKDSGFLTCIGSRINRNRKHGIFFSGTTTCENCIINSCTIEENSYTNSGVYDGINFTGGHATHIRRVIINSNNIGDPYKSTQKYGINIGAGNGIIVTNNAIVTEATGTIVDTSIGTSNIIRDNIGFITENSGTATLANGTTSIVVTHGLTITPAAGDIIVTPIEAWGNMTQFYIDTYTSTQFTIHANINPGQDVDFAWKATVL